MGHRGGQQRSGHLAVQVQGGYKYRCDGEYPGGACVGAHGEGSQCTGLLRFMCLLAAGKTRPHNTRDVDLCGTLTFPGGRGRREG